MAGLDVSDLAKGLLPTGTWAAALLHAIARDEAAGRRPARVTEPKLDTWTRFRGRLSSADFVSLLFEDAAIIHPIPFDAAVVGSQLALGELPDTVAGSWLGSMASLALDEPSTNYIAEQARLLGLPTRKSRKDLHVIKAHQKVLELPGTGGQLAYHLVSDQKELTLQDNFLIACETWQERTMAGIVALELGAPHSSFIAPVESNALHNPEHPLRQRSYDFVVGLHPERGGKFQAEDQLALWFPTAKLLLV